MRRLLVLACLLPLGVCGSASAASSITDQLTPSKTAVEITSLPTGTDHVGVAVMQNLAGAGVKYGISVPVSQKTYTPPAGYPVVDLIADNAKGEGIGGWAGRLQTVPAGSSPELEAAEKELAAANARAQQLAAELAAEKKLVAQIEARIVNLREAPHEEPPVEEPPHEEEHHAGSFVLGINAGGWGASTEVPDLLNLGSTVRLDSPSGSLSAYESKGVRVIADMSGPYSSSGVSGVNVTSYVERVDAQVRANPHLYAVEVLNEPGGSWFWGSGSESAANREAYARLVIAVHNSLVSFGPRPLELCSMDGGHDSSDAFGEAWTKNTTALADCDGLTNHPYGGTGARASAILGNRGLVERTETVTHKPIYVTEVGFPTKGPTGDSLQYSEGEEAQAIYGFAGWARSTGYVDAVTFYGYRDEAEGGGYGVELHNGAKKLAYTALREAVEQRACTVCS